VIWWSSRFTILWINDWNNWWIGIDFNHSGNFVFKFGNFPFRLIVIWWCKCFFEKMDLSSNGFWDRPLCSLSSTGFNVMFHQLPELFKFVIDCLNMCYRQSVTNVFIQTFYKISDKANNWKMMYIENYLDSKIVRLWHW
jgi:hypothetical protein